MASSRFVGQQGELERVVGVLTDVTERRQAEDALRTLQRRLLDAEARAHVGTWELDLEARQVWWSPEMYRLLRRDPALGPAELSDFLELLHPEDRGPTAQLRGRLLETGHEELRAFRSNPELGELRWFSSTAEVVRDADGNAVKIVGTILDVTENKRAELELRASEERYRSVVEGSPDAIVINQDDRVVFANPAMLRLLGAERPEQVVGKSPFSFLHPDDHDDARRVIASLAEGGSPSPPMERRFLALDGTTVDVEIVVSAVTFQGRPARQVQARDVTARKRAEGELRRAQATLLEAEARSHLGSWELDLGEGRGWWSPEMCRLFGLDPKLGAPGFSDPFADFLALVHPDDRLVVAQAQARAIATTEPVTVDFRTSLENGPVRYVSLTSQCTADAEGHPLLLRGTALDVTERKETERAVQESHQRRTLELLALGESLRAELPLRARLQELCRCVVELVGCDRSSVFLREGRHYRATCNHGNPPDIAEMFPHHRVRLDDPLISQAVSRRSYVVVNRAVGSPDLDQRVARAARIQAIVIAPFVDDAGEPLGFITAEYNENPGTFSELNATLILGLAKVAERSIVAVRDQEERERLRESLRRSEVMAAMGSLVGGVAHEVRNPLFAITATMDAMEARFREAEGMQEYLRVLRSQANRLGRLMRDLLDYGRPAQLDLVPAPICSVIADAAAACAPLAEEAGVRIVTACTASEEPLRLDQARMRQVFDNLLQNAIQVSARGSTVAVRSRPVRDEGHAWVESVVSDAGPGFRREDLPHVFEPFFSRRRGGTGLGLSIVQRIVEAHGGTASAANAPDGGAVVTIRLPTTE